MMDALDSYEKPLGLDKFFKKVPENQFEPDKSDSSLNTNLLQINQEELQEISESVKDAEIVELTEKTNIHLQITKSQLDIISEALEIYTRLGVLQLSKTVLPCIQNSDNFSYYKNNKKIITMLKQIRNMLIEENVDLEHYSNDMSDWSLGLGNEYVPKEVKVAGELHHSIEHFKYKNHSDDSKDKYAKPIAKLTDTPNAIIKIEK